MTAIYKPRYEFFACYTNALKLFVKQLELDEANKDTKLDESLDFEKSQNSRKSIMNKSKTLTNSNSNSNNNNNKYSVNGKYLTFDEVKELAHKPLSDEQIKINNERENDSKRLFEIIDTNECKVIINYYSEKNLFIFFFLFHLNLFYYFKIELFNCNC